MLNRRQVLSGVALAALTRSAWAQDYPQRPVRMIVPYAPGGASDILARLIQPHLERALGQSFVVDNRGGGASQVGTQAIATAAPDGYTIGVIDSAFVINPGLFAGKLPYDTKKDFAPVSLLAMSPLVLVVHPDVPAKSAEELVALARQKPGEVTFASAGLGTAIHLAGEQFRQVAAIEINHIPYRGGGPSVIDLLAGKVNFTFSTVPAILEHIRGGRVRALGITGARSAHLPDVPTMGEAGLAGVEFRAAVRHGGAGRGAARHHRAASRRGGGCGEIRRAQRAPDRDRLRAGRQQPGGIPHPHRRRDRQVDADHPDRQYQAHLNNRSTRE